MGALVTCTAPSAIPSGKNVTVTATSVANPSLSISSRIIIVAITAIAGSGSDSVSGFADAGDGGADFAISGSVNAQQSGIFRGAVTGLDPGSPATPGDFTLNVVDGTRALLIETDAIALTFGNSQNAF